MTRFEKQECWITYLIPHLYSLYCPPPLTVLVIIRGIGEIGCMNQFEPVNSDIQSDLFIIEINCKIEFPCIICLYLGVISMTYLPQRFKLNSLKFFIPGVPVCFSKLPPHPLSLHLLICLGADKPKWCVRFPLK